MKFCLVKTFDWSLEEFKAEAAEFEEEMNKYLAEQEIAKVNDDKAAALFVVTDMAAFKEIFDTPKAVDFILNTILQLLYTSSKNFLN